MPNNGASRMSSAYAKQYCSVLVLIVVALGMVYTLLCKWPYRAQWPGLRRDMAWIAARHQTTAEPYTQFIDPNRISFQRMFYSGRLVSPSRGADPFQVTNKGRLLRQRQPSSPEGNVTVFQPAQGYSGTCVPFHVPANRTLTICTHDRRVDQMISAYIQDYGVWEREQVEGMASLLRADEENYKEDTSVGLRETGEQQESKEAPGELAVVGERLVSVVDIGCNVGVYTLAAASLGHEVLALDPVQSNLQLLSTSLRLANLSSQVTLLLNAVSSTRGPVTLHLQLGNIGGSSVSENRWKAPRERDLDDQLTVWAVCLNDLVPHVRTGRVFLKLDIEGWEARALRCAGDFFQQLDVRYVLMEWLFYRKNPGGPGIINFMVRNGLLPYSDYTRATMLEPGKYYSWPDNVVWIKR